MPGDLGRAWAMEAGGDKTQSPGSQLPAARGQPNRRQLPAAKGLFLVRCCFAQVFLFSWGLKARVTRRPGGGGGGCIKFIFCRDGVPPDLASVI